MREESARGPIEVSRASIIGVVLASALTSAGQGSLFPPPSREFSHGERLENAVGVSDAILLCTLQSFNDTLVPNPETRDSYLREASVTVRPERWIMGGTATGKTLMKVRLADPMGSRPRALVGNVISSEALLFLRRVGSAWVLNQGTSLAGGGVLLLEPASRDQVLGDVEHAVERQSLDSLVARADLGIVGRSKGTSRRGRPSGVNALCWTVDIDEVLFGAPEGKSVSVYCLVGYVPSEPAVLLLARDSLALYHPIGFESGLLRLSGARVQGRPLNGSKLVDAVRKAADRLGRSK